MEILIFFQCPFSAGSNDFFSKPEALSLSDLKFRLSRPFEDKCNGGAHFEPADGFSLV